MSRRSSHLMSFGYDNSDDESDSSTVTTSTVTTYPENSVRVIKRKVGVRKKPASLPLIRTIRSLDPAGLSPSPLSLQAEAPMGPLAPTTSTPRTPLFLRPGRKELNQSALDSSGDSSSDGPRRKTPTTRTTKTTGTSGAPSAAYWDRIRCAFYSLMQWCQGYGPRAGLGPTVRHIRPAGDKSGWVPETGATLQPVIPGPKRNAHFGASFRCLSRLKLKKTIVVNFCGDSALSAGYEPLIWSTPASGWTRRGDRHRSP
ncbi:uncharacterized protein LOC130203182 [Pseudoliparis swirei]|uniref:uncharacterized protein LOC130203182 n=1 Tax=Pseudoliparis swirei TaxID=2059687 RepID=UPI0024BE54A1|nr:uncharacterized protein LOC130203182 [Pseudoliparis swirei]